MTNLDMTSLQNVFTAFDGTAVTIKYDLNSSADVVIQNLYIGYTEIDLGKDQDPEDRNHFVSGSEGYSAVYREQGLRVSVLAVGMMGGFWELKISVKGPGDDDFKNLKANPIKCSTDLKGHLDTNKFVK